MQTYCFSNFYYFEKSNKLAPVDKASKRNFDKAIRTMKTLSEDELKKQSKALYEEKIAKEDYLIAGVESGKVTDPQKVKQANAIKAKRAAAAKKPKAVEPEAQPEE